MHQFSFTEEPTAIPTFGKQSGDLTELNNRSVGGLDAGHICKHIVHLKVTNTCKGDTVYR